MSAALLRRTVKRVFLGQAAEVWTLATHEERQAMCALAGFSGSDTMQTEWDELAAWQRASLFLAFQAVTVAVPAIARVQRGRTL